MSPRHFVALCGLVAALALPSRPAFAQYRNKSLAFDVSYMAFTKPSLTDSSGVAIDEGGRGDRFTRGIRLGGEGAFKLHRDHWWFVPRLNLMALMFGRPQGDSLEEMADRLASDKLGFNLGLEGQAGVRYYFLTDRIRPYLQISLSYLHVWSFGSASSSSCTDTLLCTEADTYVEELMPRRNFMGVHVAPSIEFIVARDVALHVILDYTRWVVFRGVGNNVFTAGLGVTLFG